MNRAIIEGNLGQDPELRKTQNGTSVVEVSVATNEYSKGQDGQIQTFTTWHNVTAWRYDAEKMAKAHKGDAVLVEGRIRNEKYTDKNGAVKYRSYIKADSVKVFGRGTEQAETIPEAVTTPLYREAPEPVADDDLPDWMREGLY